MQKDLDLDLLKSFQRDNREIPDEPFLTDVSTRIKRVRSRRVLARKILQAVAIVAVVVASPWLIGLLTA